MNRVRFAVVILVLGSAAAVPDAAAQSPGGPFEIGAQLAVLRLSDFGVTSAGIGGRASVDLARWLTVEGEATFFPHDDLLIAQTTLPNGPHVSYHRRRAEAFFGPKMGYRGDRFGVFGKVRPGFARLTDKGIGCVGEVCSLMLLVRPLYRTEFALDYGGILDVYLSRHTLARVDLGDLLIRHRSLAPPCQRCTSHNFTSRVGIGFRF
jgi:hypothetical protein